MTGSAHARPRQLCTADVVSVQRVRGVRLTHKYNADLFFLLHAMGMQPTRSTNLELHKQNPTWAALHFSIFSPPDWTDFFTTT